MFSPPIVLFFALGSFVLGVAAGIRLTLWLFAGRGFRFAACEHAHPYIQRLVAVHLESHPLCEHDIDLAVANLLHPRQHS
jgi:hypothetical protein